MSILDKVKIGNSVQVNLELSKDRLSKETIDAINASSLGKINDFRITDGKGIGVVLQLSNGKEQWFFEDEIDLLDENGNVIKINNQSNFESNNETEETLVKEEKLKKAIVPLPKSELQIETKKQVGKDENALSIYGKDLTESAKKGLLDPVLGRENEINNLMRVLCRRNKNNPILIGNPGVGKTSIAKLLAQLIVDKKVPDSLKDFKIISLDLGALVSGTKFRGQLEERLSLIMQELTIQAKE